ncbi:hypothetical protein FDECE_15346, partial [Fusarium decemcellulare]
MKRLPGRHLYKIWDDLSLDNKKAALSEIASVIVQFASLRFEKIGCLTQGGIGPIVSPCYQAPKGPFDSTLAYLESFVSTNMAESLELAELFQQIRTELAVFTRQDNLVYLEPPFALIHADFDAQNMLFVESPDGLGLELTGLIDFEFAHTGPVYYLYEYPIFIQDVSWSKHLYAENAALRAHFISQIFNGLPDLVARKTFIAAINSKCFLLNSFRDSFMSMQCSEDTLIQSATYYLKSLKDGTGLAYTGRLDYKPEFYSDLGKPIDSETPITADETLGDDLAMRRIKALVRKGKHSLRAGPDNAESTTNDDRPPSGRSTVEPQQETSDVGSSSDTHLAAKADASVTSAREDCSPVPGSLNQHKTPQDENETVESFTLANIWAEAYNKVQADPEHSKLLANLESYLNKGVADGDIGQLKLIQRTAEEKLEKLPEAQLAFKIRGKQIVVRQAVVKAIQVITAFKPIISGAVSAEPHAALAWAGVMTVLPILENIFQQDQDAADGLNNIVFLMARYQQLQEASFASEFQHSSHTEPTRQLLSRIRTELVSIYAQVYVYETRFVLQYATRNKSHRSLRNTVNADDWKRLWADIESTSRRIDQGVQDRVGARTLEMWQQVSDIVE